MPPSIYSASVITLQIVVLGERDSPGSVGGVPLELSHIMITTDLAIFVWIASYPHRHHRHYHRFRPDARDGIAQVQRLLVPMAEMMEQLQFGYQILRYIIPPFNGAMAIVCQ